MGRGVAEENIRLVRDGDIATKKKVNKHVTQQVKIGEEKKKYEHISTSIRALRQSEDQRESK